MYGVEKGLDHYRSTITLNFEHFKYYLSQEVFTSLPSTLTLSEIRNYEKKIDEVCWLVCRKKYLTDNNDGEESTKTLIYSDEIIYKLFRIFCMLGDYLSGPDVGVVILHSSEVVQIVKQLMVSLGLDYENNKRFEELQSVERQFNFEEFIELVEFREFNIEITDCREPLCEAINEMFQTYIEDVIRKGYLHRRGYLLPTLREYWFVLQPCELSYYKNASGNVLCGTIPLTSSCTVKLCPTTGTSGKQEKFQRFVISSGERNFELATQDHRSRMQWVAALQLAITYSAGKEGYQRDLSSTRRSQREIQKNKRTEEETLKFSHIKEAKVAKEQLERERKARLDAENQARQFKAVAMEDSRRVAELEDIKLTLEKLLEDETQAKRDEEIVRALQARVLAEEWEKREELERLQDEQRALLERERQKRELFEIKQKDKEDELRAAERKLKQLEVERENLDKELKQARLKILQSEETKEVLEAKLQVKSNEIEKIYHKKTY